jgi:uncharacterized protein (TIGR00106 family)
MKVIVDLCVVPIGVGVHLAPTIAACEKVLTGAGLKIQLHPIGTAIEASHQTVHAMGCRRVYTTVKINTRTDKDQSLEQKVAGVQALLHGVEPSPAGRKHHATADGPAPWRC